MSEPPHFLVPCYTATVDCWLDPHDRQLRIAAEAYPPVMRHQTLLNAVFETGDLVWRPRVEEMCEPMGIATYHKEFPELWENHDLVIHWAIAESRSESHSFGIIPPSRFPQSQQTEIQQTVLTEQAETQGYVFRLFVSGSNASTEHTLKTVHQLLEKALHHPYTLKVIDVFKHPEQAEKDQISATPTLIKVWPKPVRRIVGELNNVDKIMRLLSSSEF